MSSLGSVYELGLGHRSVKTSSLDRNMPHNMALHRSALALLIFGVFPGVCDFRLFTRSSNAARVNLVVTSNHRLSSLIESCVHSTTSFRPLLRLTIASNHFARLAGHLYLQLTRAFPLIRRSGSRSS